MPDIEAAHILASLTLRRRDALSRELAIQPPPTFLRVLVTEACGQAIHSGAEAQVDESFSRSASVARLRNALAASDGHDPCQALNRRLQAAARALVQARQSASVDFSDASRADQ